jgi:hypothetical protein
VFNIKDSNISCEYDFKSSNLFLRSANHMTARSVQDLNSFNEDISLFIYAPPLFS